MQTMTLWTADIPFETEEELRVRGTARTPDILLSCPVGIRVRKKEPDQRNDDGLEDEEYVNHQNIVSLDGDGNDDDYEWKIVCWIDSKVGKIA